jgi:hypothetical protein
MVRLVWHAFPDSRSANSREQVDFLTAILRCRAVRLPREARQFCRPAQKKKWIRLERPGAPAIGEPQEEPVFEWPGAVFRSEHIQL